MGRQNRHRASEVLGRTRMSGASRGGTSSRRRRTRDMQSIVVEEARYQSFAMAYRLRHRRRMRPKILVNGSPKSGTMWMINMIEAIPGYSHVGNFRHEIQRFNSVQPGDVVHGHQYHTKQLEDLLTANEIKTILVIRDPRDQIVSYLFHVLRDPKDAWRDRLRGVSIDDALMCCIEGRPGLRGVRALAGLPQTWLAVEPDMTCVRYEDLVADPETEMSKVLRYLGLGTSPGLVWAVVTRGRFERMSTGGKLWRRARRPGEEDVDSHLRKGVSGDWKTYFTDAHVERFKELAGERLTALGYEGDMDW